MSEMSDVGKIATALGLFASAIKSGEQWSEQCERINKEAHEALSRLAALVIDPVERANTKL